MFSVDPNDLVFLVGAKEAELFALRKENAQLKQTLKATEEELVRLRDNLVEPVNRIADQNGCCLKPNTID